MKNKAGNESKLIGGTLIRISQMAASNGELVLDQIIINHEIKMDLFDQIQFYEWLPKLSWNEFAGFINSIQFNQTSVS